ANFWNVQRSAGPIHPRQRQSLRTNCWRIAASFFRREPCAKIRPEYVADFAARPPIEKASGGRRPGPCSGETSARLLGTKSGGPANSEMARQLRHLESGQSRFVSLVAALQSGSVDSLFQRVASEDAENNRSACVKLCQLNASSNLGCDVVKMRRFAPQ